MRKLPFLLILVILFGCQPVKKLPKVAICGLAIECSTFSPAQTGEEAFHARVGDDLLAYYPFMAQDSSLRQRANWVPTLRGHSLPGGIVTREAYESLMGKMLALLEENAPYDGVYFDIHGAMSVVGLDDPEGDMIKRVREVVGEDILISTCMDLHGNVSPTLAEQTDLMTAYRLAPHEDAMESKRRAVANLLDRLESGKGKPPYKAWIPVTILLPGEQTSARIAVSLGAVELAEAFWAARHEVDFVAPTVTLEEALEKALSSDAKPFIISDMGDNPTAGGAGDVTWTLRELMARPEFQSADGSSLIYASIPGPELVAQAKEVGVGGQVDAMAGAAVDDRFSPPLQLKGEVTVIQEGDIHAETEVVVKVGSISVIVTGKRKPYHHESDFTNLGLTPRESDIVVVKIGYLVPELYDMRGDWVMALTPGGVDQDLERLGSKRINRPMYPLDKDMADPDLSARMMKLANE